jgi:hypothetical protein
VKCRSAVRCSIFRTRTQPPPRARPLSHQCQPGPPTPAGLKAQQQRRNPTGFPSRDVARGLPRVPPGPVSLLHSNKAASPAADCRHGETSSRTFLHIRSVAAADRPLFSDIACTLGALRRRSLAQDSDHQWPCYPSPSLLLRPAVRAQVRAMRTKAALMSVECCGRLAGASRWRR